GGVCARRSAAPTNAKAAAAAITANVRAADRAGANAIRKFMTDPFPPARVDPPARRATQIFRLSAGCLFANYGDNVTPPGRRNTPILLCFPGLHARGWDAPNERDHRDKFHECPDSEIRPTFPHAPKRTS